MNERIQQLAEQATTIVDTVNSQGYSSSYANFDKEKFALLLMREIAMVQITHQAGMDLENKKMDDPAKELNYAVIEHFGVGK
jgi:predicted methyltransferase